MFFEQFGSVLAHRKVVIRFARSYGLKDSRRQYDVLIPLATPSGVITGLEFGVFG